MSASAPADEAHPVFVSPPLPELLATLTDASRPVAARLRAVFYLRTLGGPTAVAALCAALRDARGTVLFRHEVAYVLGQMQAADAVGDLLAVLRDTADEPIVRHEVRHCARGSHGARVAAGVRATDRGPSPARPLPRSGR